MAFTTSEKFPAAVEFTVSSQMPLLFCMPALDEPPVSLRFTVTLATPLRLSEAFTLSVEVPEPASIVELLALALRIPGGVLSKAGFRMLLFGLESANQKTLDKINKNLKVEQIIDSCKKAKEAKLEPHLTIMLGYPWESREDAFRTFELAKYLFEKGYADTLQATIVIPYPGTPLFEECREKGLLTTEDWNEYDMRKLVMKTPLREEDVKEITQGMYKLFFNPKYAIKKIATIRSFDDLGFAFKGMRKVFGHIKDFSNKEKCP